MTRVIIPTIAIYTCLLDYEDQLISCLVNPRETTRDVSTNDGTLSSPNTGKLSHDSICDEFLTNWTLSWNERHICTTMMK